MSCKYTENIMKNIIKTDQAPAAIGSYSQAIIHNQILYTSGQIAIIPETGQMLTGDFTEQAQQVFKNLAAIAAAAGTALEHAIKLNVYLQDLANFDSLNQIMNDHIQPPYPARAAIQAARLPKDALIEIDAIIAIP